MIAIDEQTEKKIKKVVCIEASRFKCAGEVLLSFKPDINNMTLIKIFFELGKKVGYSPNKYILLFDLFDEDCTGYFAGYFVCDEKDYEEMKTHFPNFKYYTYEELKLEKMKEIMK